MANYVVQDRGQGANHAVEDAFHFVEAIKTITAGKITLEETINAYDAEVIKRGAAEVEASVQNTFMFLSYDNMNKSELARKGIAKH
jgi:2-polyprenyl-6-methoxyphenol hydroxylase-like FAD-dependent oxidoreductase